MRLPIGFFWKTFNSTSSRGWRVLVFLCALSGAAHLAAQPAGGSDRDVQVRAEGGDADAQNTLGNQLTAANKFTEALVWYERAAGRGFAPAQFNLGLVHELGRGVAVDLRQAFRYYLLAAEQGFIPAQFNTGNMYATGRGVGQDLFEANIWFKQAAEKGLAEAQFNLGLAYEAGRGIRRDEEQAVRWYKAAAEQGFVAAQFNLGMMVEDGRGVAKDEKAAVTLYQIAAERGYAPAQNNLGLMYASGRGGLNADSITGYAWLTLAVEGGASPMGRDFVARSFTGDMRTRADSAANQLRDRLRRGEAPSRVVAQATAPTVPAPTPAEDNRLREELAQALAANSRFAEANQRLVLEKGQLELDKAQLEKALATQQTASRSSAEIPTEIANARRDLAATQTRLQNSELTVARLAEELATARELGVSSGTDNRRDLQDEVARLRRLASESSSLRAMNDRLEGELQRLRSTTVGPGELEKARLQLATAQASDELARRELGQLKTDLTAAQNAADSSLAQLAALQSELVNLRAQAGTARVGADEIAQLRTRVDELTSANARLTAAARHDDAPLISAQKQIDDLQTQLAIAEADRASVREDALKLRDQYRAGKQALSDSATRLGQLENEMQQIRSAAGSIDTRGAELRRQLLESEKTAGLLRAENLASRQALTVFENRVDHLQRENLEIRAAAGSNDAGLVEMRRRIAEAQTATEQMQAKLDAANLTIAARENELIVLRAQPPIVREVADERMPALEHQLAVAEADRASIREDALKLRDEYRAGQQAIAAANSRIEQLERENQGLRAATGSSDAGNAELGRQLANAQQAAAQLRAELASVKETVGAQANEIVVLRTAGQARNDAALVTALAQVDNLQVQLAVAEADRASVREDALKLRDEFRAERHALAAVEGQVARLQSENQGLRAAAGATDVSGAELRQQLEDARNAAGQLRVELAAAQQAERDRTKEIAVLRDQPPAVQKIADERVPALEKQLAAANRAVETHGSSVAELTAAHANLERQLEGARQDAGQLPALRAQVQRLLQENIRLAGGTKDTAALDAARSQIATLEQQLAAARSSLARADSGASELAQLRLELAGAQRTADSHSAQVTELTAARERLEKELLGARSGTAEVAQLQNELAETTRAADSLHTQVAELTAANAKLEKDLTNALKSTDAALAAQAQAVNAARPDAYQMEIRTLEDRVRQLDSALQEDRTVTAREIASLAEQLLKSRETSKALSDANRALLAVRQSDSGPSRQEFDQVQTRVRELTSIGEEMRRQNEKLNAENERLARERDEIRVQLAESDKVEASNTRTVAELTQANASAEQERNQLLNQIADLTRQLTAALGARNTADSKLVSENRALEGRLQAVGTELASTQREIEALKRQQSESAALAATANDASEKVRTELTALQSRLSDAEKISEFHGSSVAELTVANAKLTDERDALQRQLAVANAETTRVAVAQRATESQLTNAERNAAQTNEVLSAQLQQVQRELAGLRAANQRLADSNVTLDRDRQQALNQVRQENVALSSRLSQAQNTLDQIAAAARLGTPAAGIAVAAQPGSGQTPPLLAASVEARFHVVADGDSLSRLSLLYYGTSNRWQEIYNANRDVLAGENSLRVGQRLRIP
ncbi:MAG: LysM peptidoglycan-binding domain-containing protein [Candidatus Didemnitutus sp.]|nr:LysM peptidoglycan-binding domain-containing protein [Candidatus Didemnitutus sp.]